MIHTRAAIALFALVGACHSSGTGAADLGPPDMTPPSDADLLASRPYLASVPAGYTSAQSWPLLIVLAGYGGKGADTSYYLGFTQLASSQGAFLVTPDGLLDSHASYAWNPQHDQFPQFDVKYLTAIIHDLEAKYSIDPKRVFVVGHSLGAHMAHRMACDAANDVVAIMSLAGQVSKDPADCAPSRAVSVLQIHGTADMTIGYYGDVQNNPPDPTIPSAHETVGVWARNDQCSGPIAATGATLHLDSSLTGNETTVEAYSGCPPGIAVELWSIVGGSHDPQPTLSFATQVWGFLTAHARP
ncbi:MAG: alpha/beta hydrolase family esterase [Polyangia bacterium]